MGILQTLDPVKIWRQYLGNNDIVSWIGLYNQNNQSVYFDTLYTQGRAFGSVNLLSGQLLDIMAVLLYGLPRPRGALLTGGFDQAESLFDNAPATVFDQPAGALDDQQYQKYLLFWISRAEGIANFAWLKRGIAAWIGCDYGDIRVIMASSTLYVTIPGGTVGAQTFSALAAEGLLPTPLGLKYNVTMTGG